MKTPESLYRILDYANAHPNEDNWQGVVLGPFARFILPPGAEPPNSSVFGVHSLDQLEKVLDELRQFLRQLISLPGVFTLEAETLLNSLNDRARLKFKRWWFDSASGRLIDELETEGPTFHEALYSMLGLALKDVSYRDIHQCEACAMFFYSPSGREVKFCSAACRNRTLVRRHRQRISDGGKANPGRPKRPPARKTHARRSSS